MFDEWVESGGGFVEDEDIDVGGEGGDEHDFLPVAFGVGADFFGGVEFESFNVFGAFFLVVTGGSEFGEGVEDLVAGEVREEFYIPWDVGDAVDGGFGGVGVVDAAGSGGGVDESEEAADGGGFAGAVGSEESVDCAMGDGEVDVVEYPGFPEILAELRNLNRISVHAFTIKCDVTLHASPRRFTTPSRVCMPTPGTTGTRNPA